MSATPFYIARAAQGNGRKGFDLSAELRGRQDRKSTRLNSSHTVISYAVFCLKKKKIVVTIARTALNRLVDYTGHVSLGHGAWYALTRDASRRPTRTLFQRQIRRHITDMMLPL